MFWQYKLMQNTLPCLVEDIKSLRKLWNAAA
jgi:hypothetical protein